MRILKKGNNQPPVYYGKCNGCKCEFEAESSEVNYFSDPRSDGDSGYHVNCPTCKYWVWVILKENK